MDALRKVVLFPIKVQGYSQSPSFMLVCIFYRAGGTLGPENMHKSFAPSFVPGPSNDDVKGETGKWWSTWGRC